MPNVQLYLVSHVCPITAATSRNINTNTESGAWEHMTPAPCYHCNNNIDNVTIDDQICAENSLLVHLFTLFVNTKLLAQVVLLGLGVTTAGADHAQLVTIASKQLHAY